MVLTSCLSLATPRPTASADAAGKFDTESEILFSSEGERGAIIIIARGTIGRHSFEGNEILLTKGILLNHRRRSLHNQKKVCSSCGFPGAKTRKCTSNFETFSSSPYPDRERRGTELLTRRDSRQLVREGKAQKDHRHRPDAVPQHRREKVQERLPDWFPQGHTGTRDRFVMKEDVMGDG